MSAPVGFWPVCHLYHDHHQPIIINYLQKLSQYLQIKNYKKFFSIAICACKLRKPSCSRPAHFNLYHLLFYLIFARYHRRALFSWLFSLNFYFHGFLAHTFFCFYLNFAKYHKRTFFSWSFSLIFHFDGFDLFGLANSPYSYFEFLTRI